MTKRTVLLDREKWDLILDAQGNIAVGEPPYAVAQDMASAIRLFQGEAEYDTARGVPYFQQILGQQPAVGVMKAALNKAALSVPGVTSSRTFLASVAGRTVTGQVQGTTATGTVVVSGDLLGNPTPS